jgi:hypothetical protein
MSRFVKRDRASLLLRKTVCKPEGQKHRRTQHPYGHGSWNAGAFEYRLIQVGRLQISERRHDTLVLTQEVREGVFALAGEGQI